MSAVSKCRSCGAQIYWVINQGTGNRMPLDAEPSPRGMFELVDGDVAVYVPKPGRGETGPLHDTHFSTCPDAKGWRRRQVSP